MRKLWNEWKAQALPCETTGQKLFSILLGAAIPIFFLVCVMGACGVFIPTPAKAGGIGAATYNAAIPANQNLLITVSSNSNCTVCLADSDYTLVHLNINSANWTQASTSGDYVVMMNQQTPAGVAVTMQATYDDNGNGKTIIQAGASVTFNGDFVPQGSDGQHEIQLQAVGHGCKMMLIRGHFTPP